MAVSPLLEPGHVLDRLWNTDVGAFSVLVLRGFEARSCRFGFLDDLFGHLLPFSNGFFGGRFVEEAAFFEADLALLRPSWRRILPLMRLFAAPAAFPVAFLLFLWWL